MIFSLPSAMMALSKGTLGMLRVACFHTRLDGACGSNYARFEPAASPIVLNNARRRAPDFAKDQAIVEAS